MLNRLDAERVLRPLYPAVEVDELLVRTGGENSAVYEARCRVPAERVIIKVYPAKTRALLDGYGIPPATWPAAFPLYRLYHALELWDWYAQIGNDAPLGGLAADLAAIVT